MQNKSQIIAKIKILILVSEKNRSRLIDIVERAEDDAVLDKVFELAQKEELKIGDYLKQVIHLAVASGDAKTLQTIQELLKKKPLQIRKGEEADEKVQDEQNLESLINSISTS